MNQDLPALALDLLEVAAYVYCADQSRSRGGATFPKNGLDWYRQFELNIPVRCKSLWKNHQVMDKLTALLGFLSDDSFTFNFRSLDRDVPRDAYLAFDDGQPWFKPDSILLFSGGLDSLTGAVEELQNPETKLMLVSHRPVNFIYSTQKRLAASLIEKFQARSRILHIPVSVNKESGITKDANQRTRSFLYASIATVLAMLTDSDTLKFYENGIVSCNLPISEQVVGARASRSTHPKSLSLMSDFFSELLRRDFHVLNPFFDKTKTDVIALLKAREATELIETSNSCTRTRSASGYQNHCGVCSQCIERRIATLANGLEAADPGERYQKDLFLDDLEKPTDRVMVESYIQHARSLEGIGDIDFFQKFPDGYRIVNSMKCSLNEAGRIVYELHRRHGIQVGGAVNLQIERNAENIRAGRIPPKSLLGMIISQSVSRQRKSASLMRFPAPAETKWEDVTIELTSNDSLRIKVGSVTKRYHGVDIGFRDARKGDLLNQQWTLLEYLAQNGGTLSWQSTGIGRIPTTKGIQALNKTLKLLLGLDTNPISRYERGIGWVTKFTIADKRYGQS